MSTSIVDVRRAPSKPPGRANRRPMLNKVPEITAYFWIIKILCTTVGETFADFLNTNLNLGLANTTYIMGGAFIVVACVQFRLRRYVPAVYWLSVVLISVVGTLITDNLTDHIGVSLITSTLIFSGALGATFVVWYLSEQTLSIHTIVTTRREGFYWLTVLFTFALGTAGGDLTAERLGVGYWRSALIFGGAIALTFVLHTKVRLNAILAFWIAYILTRPLGASIGDYLSQPKDTAGLGLGTTTTSMIFLAAILCVVVFLTISGADRIDSAYGSLGTSSPPPTVPRPAGSAVLVVTNKVAASPALIGAVRARAGTGADDFVLLVPNPAHLAFDRVGTDIHEGISVLDEALPALCEAVGRDVGGVVANSPNAYDDIVEELNRRPYGEIIIETPPVHVSHWMHVELERRIAHLGYPVTMVAATH